MTVAFSTSGGQLAAAVIVNRAPSIIEAIIPSTATTGAVKVANASGTIGTLSFTLAADPAYAKVATLAGKPSGDDDHEGGNGSAAFRQPVGLALSPAGDVYVADASMHQIRRVTPAGVVSVFAGTGKPGYTEGAGTVAQFNAPQGIACDSVRKVLYVADTGNRVIRKVAFDGTLSFFAGTSPSSQKSDDEDHGKSVFHTPVGLALDGAAALSTRQRFSP